MNKQKSNSGKNTVLYETINQKAGLKSGSPFIIALLVLVLLPGFMACGCTEKDLSSGAPGSAALTLLVDDQNQMDTIRDLASRYQNKTGTPVSVQSVPEGWSPNSSMSLRGDLLFADIARIPVFAGEGKLARLNPLLNTSTDVNWTLFERPTLVLAGEYPDRSGNIYALPFSQDALGILYRTDLFNDPANSGAFCLSYGYPIGIPGSYDELSDITSFFSHNEANMSGIGFAGLDGPDPKSSPWLSILSSYGSGVEDRSSGDVSGTWNSSKTLTAMAMLKNLSDSTPVGARTWGDKEVKEAFSSGRIALAVTWFSYFPDILNESGKNNLSIGVIPLPGQVISGESHRGITVSMDGIGLIQDGSQDNAIRFLTWFYSPEEQLAYASSGHQPAIVSVLDSFPYMSMNSFNRAFPESIRMGVTTVKGKNSEAVRVLCEESIRQILASGSTPEAMQNILDASSVRIKSLIKG
ncbi:MAG: extracellular solute-binding protein [Methanobacteriota archaeon]